jgi:hypothetical protein
MTAGCLRRLSVAAAFAVAFAACGDAFGPGQQARVTVLLTDAPSKYLGEAWVTIDEVALIPADGPPLTAAVAKEIELLELCDGATEILAEWNDVPPGRYLQLRLRISAVRVVLADGYQFRNGDAERALVVPSGAQTGIKINLREAEGNGQRAGIEIRPGETVLVVDVDVNQNFVIQGNPRTPAGIQGVLFTPQLRATVQDAAGAIAGTVRDPDGLLGEDGVDGLVVAAELLDDTGTGPFQTSRVTALTDDGSYTIRFLAPGTYRVTVELPEGFATDPAAREVTLSVGENATGIDFDVIEEDDEGS